MAEQVDAVDSKSTGTWYCAGSSPAPGTNDEKASPDRPGEEEDGEGEIDNIALKTALLPTCKVG